MSAELHIIIPSIEVVPYTRIAVWPYVFDPDTGEGFERYDKVICFYNELAKSTLTQILLPAGFNRTVLVRVRCGQAAYYDFPPVEFVLEPGAVNTMFPHVSATYFADPDEY